jgi:hypothetical protein
MKLFLQLMRQIAFFTKQWNGTYAAVDRVESYYDDKIYEALSRETVISQYFYMDLLHAKQEIKRISNLWKSQLAIPVDQRANITLTPSYNRAVNNNNKEGQKKPEHLWLDGLRSWQN